MFGRKYLMILGVLALLSVGVSAGISGLFGGAKKASPAAGPQPGKAEAMPAKVQTIEDKPAPGQEQVQDLVHELRLRLGEVQRREARLGEQEKRVQMAEEGLQRRAKELEALRMELIGPLTRLKEATAELDKSRMKVSAEEKQNITRVAATFEKMDAEGGSGILMGMCANNQADDVVKILYYMSERAAAKVLGAMTDKALAARLTAMMQRIREVG
jgi:flagellar motility protein MotE (MotC chaperone)